MDIMIVSKSGGGHNGNLNLAEIIKKTAIMYYICLQGVFACEYMIEMHR